MVEQGGPNGGNGTLISTAVLERDAIELFTIGEVAARLGISTSSIRYYDGADLLGDLSRVGGQRRFDQTAIVRLRFIKTAQALGFTLNEIRAVLFPGQAVDWEDLVHAKRSELVVAQQQIQGMIDMLDESLQCGCEAFDRCPKLATEI